MFADSLGRLLDSLWLSALRGLAAGGVTLVFCPGHVGLPKWGCGASGFLCPAEFMVFVMGSPFSGRDCVLPQSAIVTKTFPPPGGFGSWPSCGVPYLRLALCSSTCVSPGGCPSFYLVWSCAFALGSSSQGQVCVGASTVGFCVFLRDVVTLWVKSVFLSLLIAEAESLREVLALSIVLPWPMVGLRDPLHYP